jgi:hypothetical protein
MKIHYRKPNLIEQINEAIANSSAGNKLIYYFELTSDELNSVYSYFDRTTNKDNTINYSYKGKICK